MDPKNAIELRGVTLSYPVDVRDDSRKGILSRRITSREENRVLDSLDLVVEKGEVLGIIGTNGAGKSTLLSIMARILEPDSGTVETCGRMATILELGMGFHQDLSGRENIILKGELYGFSKKQMEARVDDIIEYSGIGRYIDNPVRTYSSGMRGRLAFSIMTHVDADIMLVDEILSTGDAAFSAKASDHFKRILRDGKTVVYVSHSPGSVESVCTRVIWLDKGKIIADGGPKKVCAMYNEAMFSSPDVVMDQAKSGMSEAQYRLASFYRDGVNVERDEEAYRSWLQLAAEQGHLKAQTELADILMDGTAEDRERAIIYYQSSASRGDRIARSRLSSIYGGSKVREERRVIGDVLHLLAETGNPVDIFRYANFLLTTAWDDSDRKESLRWFKRAAEEFYHPDALIQLAVMYRDGIGTRKNRTRFIEMLKLGSDLGFPKAMNMLADIYSAGVIVEEDQKEALALYEGCAENGIAPCQYIVATMYMEGKGTEPDQERARYWFDEYSRSQLLSFGLNAVSRVKDRDIPIDIDGLYDGLMYHNDPRAALVSNEHLAEKSDPENKDALSQSYRRMSRHQGRGAVSAFRHYSDPLSNEYDESMAFEIGRRIIHMGDPSVLFGFSMICLRRGDADLDVLGNRCLTVSARMGHRDAIAYCGSHGISYRS